MTRYTETLFEKIHRIQRRIDQIEAKRQANLEASPPEASEHLVTEGQRLQTLLQELTEQARREDQGLDQDGVESSQSPRGRMAEAFRGGDSLRRLRQETIRMKAPSER